MYRVSPVIEKKKLGEFVCRFAVPVVRFGVCFLEVKDRKQFRSA